MLGKSSPATRTLGSTRQFIVLSYIYNPTDPCPTPQLEKNSETLGVKNSRANNFK